MSILGVREKQQHWAQHAVGGELEPAPLQAVAARGEGGGTFLSRVTGALSLPRREARGREGGGQAESPPPPLPGVGTIA